MHPLTNTAAQTTPALDLSQRPVTAQKQHQVRISLRGSAGAPQACDKYSTEVRFSLMPTALAERK